MKKKDELSTPFSCINKARDEEMVFVLLGRDIAAPSTVRFWIEQRIRLGINRRTDAQILEAERCANEMFNYIPPDA